jgi:hypothetical protein
MSQGLQVVIGMSIAYLFSFLGLLLAYFSYKKKHKKDKKE